MKAERCETRDERAERVFRELTGRTPLPQQLTLEPAKQNVVSMREWLAQRRSG